MSGLSICFLGTGAINRKHIGIVRKLVPGAQLSVASRDPERARRYAAELRLPRWFGDYQSGIESDHRVIVVGVPPSQHFALVGAALTAGKHVLVEKPAFNSLAEFAALAPRIAAHPGVVMVAENVHFDAFHRRIKATLQAGDLGRPLLFELSRLGVTAASGWRADPAEMPFGALHEGGVHWIRRIVDLASVFEPDGSGGVDSVLATAPLAPRSGAPGEDTALVIARHRSGLTSRLFHSWSVRKRSRLFDASRFVLEDGTIYFDPDGVFGVVMGKRHALIAPRVRDAGGYRAMWQHFIACVDHGEPPELTFDHIRYDFAVLDAAYRSMKSGAAVAL